MAGGCVKCMKYTFFIFNFIIALSGLGLIVTGCLLHFGFDNWIQVPIQEVAVVLENEVLRSATYMIIGAGALAFLIAICGCLGAIMENRCLLVLYCLFLLVSFAVQVVAARMVALYSSEITLFLETEGKDFLHHEYGNTKNKTAKPATEGWDVIQERLECCGVNGPIDYTDNPNLGGSPYPDSCCMNRMEDPTSGKMVCTSNPQPYRRGCKQQIEDLIKTYSTLIAASAIGVAAFEKLCILFTIVLVICIGRNIDDDDNPADNVMMKPWKKEGY